MISVTVTTREGDIVDLAFRYPGLATIRKAQGFERQGDTIEAAEVLFKECCLDKALITDSVLLALVSDQGEIDGEGNVVRQPVSHALMNAGTVAFRKP